MDLKEARSLFRHYRGWLFMMGREEPSKYHEFASLQIPKDTFESWRQELIAEYFSDIVRILQSTLTLKEENGEKILDLLIKILEEENCDRGLIMNIVYGNSYSRKDSLLCWIENNTSLSEKLDRILNFYMKL